MALGTVAQAGMSEDTPILGKGSAHSIGIHWGGKVAKKGIDRGFELWYPVLWWNGGGTDAVSSSLTIHTETGHTYCPNVSTADTTLGEAGLMSLKRAYARNYDLDACDPNQNVWGSAKGRQERADKLEKNYPWIEKLSFEDRIFFEGMVGGAGGAVASCLVAGSDAKSVLQGKKWKGSLKNIIFGWIKTEGEGFKDAKYDSCWGRTNAPTAIFRASRLEAKIRLVKQKYGGGKKGLERWKNCIRPEAILVNSPFGKGNYPGDEEHGKCHPTPKKDWDMPPAGYRNKMGKKGKKDIWMKYCGDDAKCLTGSYDVQIWYDTVYPNWKKAKQAQGLLPSDADYAKAKEEMIAADCWILD